MAPKAAGKKKKKTKEELEAERLAAEEEARKADEGARQALSIAKPIWQLELYAVLHLFVRHLHIDSCNNLYHIRLHFRMLERFEKAMPYLTHWLERCPTKLHTCIASKPSSCCSACQGRG